MNIIRHTLIAALTAAAAIASHAQTWESAPRKGFVSWQPAAKWEDALLTGNGTLGAMVMGRPFDETIILNHALLFWPGDEPVVPPDMSAHLEQIRRLCLDGRWEEAARYHIDKWREAGLGEKRWTDGYVPAADLDIMSEPSNVVRYQRLTNYETAENIVNWEDGSGVHTRSVFASRSGNMVVVNMRGGGRINSTFELKRHPHSWEIWREMNERFAEFTTAAHPDGTLTYRTLYGKPHLGSPAGYECVARVVQRGGSLRAEGSAVVVTDAEEVTVVIGIEPLYDKAQSNIEAMRRSIDTAATATYADLLAAHCAIHSEIYNRCSLCLYPTDEESAMTSETLVLRTRRATSPGIMQRQFEAARYNVLCSTGTNPPNLQGIWSGTWTPPWSADFTHDGNLPVVISNLLNGNMHELMNAYFDYHERLMEHYRINARQFYGAGGIHVPCHTSNHGYDNHFDETWCLSYWNAGAGWAASYFYDYYLFTADTLFLRRHAYPFMKEALAFWEDFLVRGADGKYVVVPSYSPENNPTERQWQVCINATMDVAIVKQLLRNCTEAARILGLDPDKRRQWTQMLADMPAYQTSADGVLREWLWPDFSDNQAHRHASHLYGLYEVPDPEIVRSKELTEAARKTIAERMKVRYRQSGGEMAFGMCHLAWAAENLGDAATAYDIASWLSRFYWTNGMATTHNPGELFNIDICGGFPSVLTRMLATSAPGSISLLPALPAQWKRGNICGVALRGHALLDRLEWDNGRATATITSASAQTIALSLPAGATQITIDGRAAGAKAISRIRLQAGVPATVAFSYPTPQ